MAPKMTPRQTTTVSQDSALGQAKDHQYNGTIREIKRRAIKVACKPTKVRTVRTSFHNVVRLSNSSLLHQRASSSGLFCVNTNTKPSTALFFLLFIMTTVVSSFPTGVDILFDIDESESTYSRVILKEPPIPEFTQKDMEISAKDFLEKFGYIKPAEWNDVAPRNFEEIDPLIDIAEEEQSGDRTDHLFGSGDGDSSPDSPKETVDFLTRSSETISEEDYREALKKYQRLNGLNETGELDNVTTSYMGRPRCGVPDQTATDAALWINDETVPNVTKESTTQLQLDELLETFTPTTTAVEEVSQELPIVDGDGNNADNDSETSSPRVKRSYNARKTTIHRYRNMQKLMEEMYGPISEGPLPNKSRIHDLKAVIDALRREKLSKLNVSKHRSAFEKMKPSIPTHPIAKLPGLVYRMVMASRSSRQKRSSSYMRSGWLRPFGHEVITWRLVEEWKTTRSLLLPSEIWYTIKLAFRMWSEVIPRKFREDRTSPISKVDILIGFGSKTHHRCRVPFRDSIITKEYAHAWPLPRAEIHFNDDQPFVSVSWDAAKDYAAFMRAHSGRTPISLFKVAIHEIGHTLGLPHLNRRESVMSPVYLPFQSKRIPEIGLEDRRDVQRLYGPCKISFDAVFDWVRPYISPDSTKKWKYNTYFFRKSWLWVYDNGGRRPGYGDPRYTKEEWKGVLDDHKNDPHKKIDGIVHIRDWSVPNGPIYIFIGNSYMEYDTTSGGLKKKDSNGNSYPRKISQGFNGIPSPIDTVFYKISERMLYFFKDNMVYRYSPRLKKFIDKRYISHVFRGWGGASPLPSNIDAAYYSYTYFAYFFFKGPYYWKLADERDKDLNKGVIFPKDSVGPMRTIASRWHYICDVDDSEINMNSSA